MEAGDFPDTFPNHAGMLSILVTVWQYNTGEWLSVMQKETLL
jgi:hypothetical protein